MDVALKHFGFAKQRFDSASAPARKYCCMLSAIVIVLIALAGDARKNKDVRQRAERLLARMDSTHVVTAGLFADYTAEAARFVRTFDDHRHDIARTYTEMHAFLHKC